MIQRLRGVLKDLRLRPFPGHTPENRARERHRRIALSAIAAAAARACTIAVTFIAVRVGLNALGHERFGLWMAMTSFIALLRFTDLGMGNGLLTGVANAYGRDDEDAASCYVSNAFFALLLVAVATTVLFLASIPVVNWSWLFNVSSSSARAECTPSLVTLVLCFALQLPLGTIQKIRIAYQEDYKNNVWTVVGSILTLIVILAAARTGAGLPWYIFAMTGAPVLALLMNGCVLFLIEKPGLVPRMSILNRKTTAEILRVGVLFLCLQLAGILGYQSNVLIISRFLGAEQVALYAVPFKLFFLIPMVMSFVLMPLWPAYGEAFARRDISWVLKTFWRSLTLSCVVSIPASLVLFLFGNHIIGWWVGSSIESPRSLILGLAIWTVMTAVGGPIAMLLNGCRVIGFQAAFALLAGAANIALSIVLVLNIGISGPVYASIISTVVFFFVPLAIYMPHLFKKWKASQS